MRSLILKNKTLAASIAIALIILIVVYYKGRSDGSEPGFFSSLFGSDDPPTERKVYIPGPGSQNWNPTNVTDSIHASLESHFWFSSNGTGINQAFQTFNALNHNQKIAVINDWENRYKGTDVYGWGQGDYGSLKEAISEFQGSFQPQVEIAWNWMNQNQIS